MEERSRKEDDSYERAELLSEKEDLHNWVRDHPWPSEEKIRSWIKEKMSNTVLSIVDIAFYHGKPDELIADIEKFSPSSLILDWCFTREGHTYKLLTSAGLISQIILENELSDDG